MCWSGVFWKGARPLLICSNILKLLPAPISAIFLLLASAFLPFLPMTSVQLLLLNLLYDILCIVMPWDNVDEEETMFPRDWSGKTLGRFMMSFGPISSLFDIATFLFLLPVSHAVRMGNLSEAYRSCLTASVCVTVPNGMVFGVHVDAGADPAFSANP